MATATDTDRPEHLQTTEPNTEAIPGALAATALACANSNPNGSVSAMEDHRHSLGVIPAEMSRVQAETSETLARPTDHETSQNAEVGTQDSSMFTSPPKTETESFYIGDENPGMTVYTNGTDSHGDELQAAVSPTDLIANGDTGLCERLKAEFKDLLRQRNAELAAKSEVKERLFAEMCELRDRSTQEARTYNELYHEIGGVGELLRCEVARLTELPSLLQAELQNEECQRKSWEAELHKECQEMQRRVQERENQVEQMEETRRSLEKNLQTALSNAVWLQRDLEDGRRTRARLQERERHYHDKTEAVIEKLKSDIQSAQQEHDNFAAQTASEDFRDREQNRVQAQKFTIEEQEVCAEIELEKQRFDEAKQSLIDDEENHRAELSTTEEAIRKTMEDLEWQSEYTQRLEEVKKKEAEIQKESAETQAVEHQCDEAQRSIKELEGKLKREAEEGVQASSRTRSSYAESRQRLSREEKELRQALQELDRDIFQAQEREKSLRSRQEEAEATNRGILGFLCRRRRPESIQTDLEAPLPAPDTAPVVVNKEAGIMRDRN